MHHGRWPRAESSPCATRALIRDGNPWPCEPSRLCAVNDPRKLPSVSSVASSALQGAPSGPLWASYLQAELRGNRREAVRRITEDGLQHGLTCLDIHGVIQQAQAVRRVRGRQPDVPIAVGGGAFGRHPGLAAEGGADLEGSDAAELVEKARLLGVPA
jgi:hypothetical protein